MAESTVEDSIAAADRRIESICVLAEMLIGQVKHERQELHEIRAAFASVEKRERPHHAVPSVIAPEMLG
jgi:hypothetical protein